MDDYPLLHVSAPIYIMTIQQPCYSCGQQIDVSAIATRSLIDPEYDDPEALNGEVCLLTNIESIPEEIARLIQLKHPRYSKTANLEYMMTVCNCGAHQGDFFVGKALFDAACNEPDLIKVEKLPIQGKWDLSCGYSYSSAYELLIDAVEKTAG